MDVNTGGACTPEELPAREAMNNEINDLICGVNPLCKDNCPLIAGVEPLKPLFVDLVPQK